jgi:hypothetical protein
MIPSIPDTVETSSNLAIITIGEGKASVQILARSSNDEMKDYRCKEPERLLQYGRYEGRDRRRLFWMAARRELAYPRRDEEIV